MGVGSNRAGSNGPSRAQRRAGTDGSIAGPGTDPRSPGTEAPGKYRADLYCAVTIVCGRRRLDLALPTSVCCSDLLPGLLRLMLSDESAAAGHPWVLFPIGGNPLTGSETLSDAGVLAGDLLVLEQQPAFPRAQSAVVMTRDRIEDVLSGGERFWDRRASQCFTLWVGLVTAAALLLPAANLAAGPASAAISAAVGVMVAMIAVLSARRFEKVCAAAGLMIGCLWAALAGVAAFRGLVAAVPLPGAVLGSMTLLVGTASALLLAGCAAADYPTAQVHLTSLVVVGIACAGLVVAVSAGAPVIDAGVVLALVAVLLLGGLPRLALAIGGLTGSDPGRDSADLDSRIHRADRVLIGCLIGVSWVAFGAVIPAALSSVLGPRLLAVGIGSLLLLRSRALSQTRHVIPPRVGALLVFCVVWLGMYRDGAAPKSVLIIGAAVAVAVVVIVFDVLDRAPTAVGLASRGRLLDLAEQTLVVVLIVLLAWVVVLGDWVAAVIG